MSPMSVTLALVAAALVLLGGPSRPRLGNVIVEELPVKGPLLWRLRPVFAVVGFVAGWSFLGGTLGVLGGLGAAVAMWVVVGRIEDPVVRRRREQLVAELPMAVDLVGSCLSAGASLQVALGRVAAAWEGPVAEEFDVIRHRLDVGVEPSAVWRDVAGDPQLAPLGRVVARALDTGAPIAQAVHKLADELRQLAASEVELRARAIEVKAAAPLGVCLLPAFVLLGVVPLVAGIFSTMQFLR